MANTYTTLGTLFTAIANAIRAKTGSSATIKADDFPTAIAAIPAGSTVYVGTITTRVADRSITVETGESFTNACQFIIAPIANVTEQTVPLNTPVLFGYNGSTLMAFYTRYVGGNISYYRFYPSLTVDSATGKIKISWDIGTPYIPASKTFMVIVAE